LLLGCQGLVPRVVVEQASAFMDMDRHQLVTDSDHFTVCRPRGPGDLRYRALKVFLEDQVATAKHA
jgi:predicted GNAT family N-acyltransferase